MRLTQNPERSERPNYSSFTSIEVKNLLEEEILDLRLC